MRNRRALAAGAALACFAVFCLGSYLRAREREILELGRPVPVWSSSEEIRAYESLGEKVVLREIPMTYVRAGAVVSMDYAGPLPSGAV